MDFWNKILQNLKQEKRIVLMVVVENKGSSPGKQGFKMMVAPSGNMIGSIGGGLSEHQLVERAKKMLAENIEKPELNHQVHNSEHEKNKSGMICSGEHTVLLYPLSDKHIDNINEIAGNELLDIETTIKLSTELFMSKSGATISSQYEFGPDGIYKEVIGYKHILNIFGGGHVGLALSKQMKLLGFKIHVYDNRDNLPTMKENKFADDKQIIEYKNLDKLFPTGENMYAVIASFSHQNDKMILSKLIHKEFKYIGMMGSKDKVNEIFTQLKNEGITEDQLKKVNAPIGVSIKSETPEEIAVSIAAEIIHIKNTTKY
jgi:xanthine dehydrogenase accessory factor